MTNIVFFGTEGAFSLMPLKALISSGLAPCLVVEGYRRTTFALRSTARLTKQSPGVLRQLLERRREGDEEDGDVSALSRIAAEHEIDVVRTDNANSNAVWSIIVDRSPDLYVVAGYPQVLSRRLLRVPKRGGINVHPGRLPQERGASPVFWTLQEGRSEFGFTVHMLEEIADSGDILFSGAISIEEAETRGRILERLSVAATPFVPKAVRAVLDGDAVRTPQDSKKIGYCPRPGFRDGRLDPQLSAEQMHRFVTACAETFSLFAECGGDRFFIKRSLGFDSARQMDFEYVLAGDVLYLRCSPGAVELELKEEGVLFTSEYVADPSEEGSILPGGAPKD